MNNCGVIFRNFSVASNYNTRKMPSGSKGIHIMKTMVFLSILGLLSSETHNISGKYSVGPVRSPYVPKNLDFRAHVFKQHT